MDKERALLLQQFLINGANVFSDLFGRKALTAQKINEYKKDFSDQMFVDVYAAFEIELLANILKYRNLETIKAYTNKYFSFFCPWNDKYAAAKKIIINQNLEIEFLLNLTTNLTEYTKRVANFCVFENTKKPSYLENYFLEIIEQDKADNYLEDFASQRAVEKPVKDERFNFNALKKECDLIVALTEKAAFIHDRLFDLAQWQIQYDYIENPEKSKDYLYSKTYYPNFELLCNIEIDRIDKKLSLQNNNQNSNNRDRLVLTKPPETQQFNLKWNANDIDLLELLTSLYKAEVFTRKDGEELNRKDLINTFEKLLGIEIKNPEVKLTRATGRNDKTPFLDKLKTAFENFGDEKEEKQRLRR